MAIKADESALRTLNKNVDSLNAEFASCSNNMDNTLSSITGNIVASGAKTVFDSIKEKNLKISSSVVEEMNTLISFLEKQMDEYQITEEKANNILDNAIRSFESANKVYESNLQNASY